MLSTYVIGTGDVFCHHEPIPNTIDYDISHRGRYLCPTPPGFPYQDTEVRTVFFCEDELYSDGQDCNCEVYLEFPYEEATCQECMVHPNGSDGSLRVSFDCSNMFVGPTAKLAAPRPPTRAPVNPPTRAPVNPPTRVPVNPPTRTPTRAPATVPARPPIRAPTTAISGPAPVASPGTASTVSQEEVQGRGENIGAGLSRGVIIAIIASSVAAILVSAVAAVLGYYFIKRIKGSSFKWNDNCSPSGVARSYDQCTFALRGTKRKRA